MVEDFSAQLSLLYEPMRAVAVITKHLVYIYYFVSRLYFNLLINTVINVFPYY